MKKHIGFISLDSSLVSWLCQALRTSAPQTDAAQDLLEGFLREGHDPKYIGTPMPIETFMHRDWETFVKEGL